MEHLKVATAATKQDLTEMRQAMAETQRDILGIKTDAGQDRREARGMFEQLFKKSEPQSLPEAPAKKAPRREAEDVLTMNDAWARAPSARTRGSDPASSSGSQAHSIATPRSMAPEQERAQDKQHGQSLKEPVMVIGGWDEPTLQQTIFEEVQVLKKTIQFYYYWRSLDSC